MNSDIVTKIKKENPNTDVSFSVLGDDAVNKFIKTIDANKEFMDAVTLIAKKLLSFLDFTSCGDKLKYEWMEIGKEGLYLIKRLGDSVIKIDCLPFTNLGILSLQNSLFSLAGFNLPDLPIFNIIQTIIDYSSLDINKLINDVLENWWTPDYVYNKNVKKN